MRRFEINSRKPSTFDPKTLMPPDLFFDPAALPTLQINLSPLPFDVRSSTACAQIIQLHLAFDL
jgi:hypothetical protein